MKRMRKFGSALRFCDDEAIKRRLAWRQNEAGDSTEKAAEHVLRRLHIWAIARFRRRFQRRAAGGDDGGKQRLLGFKQAIKRLLRHARPARNVVHARGTVAEFHEYA